MLDKLNLREIFTHVFYHRVTVEYDDLKVFLEIVEAILCTYSSPHVIVWWLVNHVGCLLWSMIRQVLLTHYGVLFHTHTSIFEKVTKNSLKSYDDQGTLDQVSPTLEEAPDRPLVLFGGAGLHRQVQVILLN